MKILAKKVYCFACHRLVRGREQKNNGTIQVHCTICDKLLWVWNGINWRAMR